MNLEGSYTLKDVKDGVATIGLAADISMKNDSLQLQGMTAKVDFKGTYSGDYLMDINSGLGKTASLSMPLKGTMEIMGMSVPVEMNTKTEMTVTPGK